MKKREVFRSDWYNIFWNIGDEVRRVDFVRGRVIGPTLKILRIEDYKPVDDTEVEKAILYLSDGSWTFKWNIVSVQK